MMNSLTTARTSFCTGTVLLALLALPFSRELLEARLATHMLIQLPLLSFAGWMLGRATPAGSAMALRGLNHYGLTGIVLFACLALIWMIPRLLEQSLDDPAIKLAKYVSLPLAGFALAWSYPIAPPVLRGLLLAHAISMLAAMGWAYLAAPRRLCNAYLADDQALTGALLLAASTALAVSAGLRALLDETRGPVTGARRRDVARNSGYTS